MRNTGFEIQDVFIVQATKRQAQLAVDWARQEGWNPGIHDADCFFKTDPEGFFVIKHAEQVIGTFSVVKYSKDFAFEGLVIVRPDWRGKGVGLRIQNFISSRFKSLNVGIDGVLQMQEKYARAGFRFAYKNTRYTGKINCEESSKCIPVRKADFEEIVAYDAKFFPAFRSRFLKCWLTQKDSLALMLREKTTNGIIGYGVRRKCFSGHKIGPLFAEDPKIAQVLLESLTANMPDEEIFLDVPEPNHGAVALAEHQGMRPVFSTARMYTKGAPDLHLDGIYGVTTFELG
jgi:GNAT superfamily N-acetyltransferase